jgi:DNA (cytosine-5)-methyltransferase 1
MPVLDDRARRTSADSRSACETRRRGAIDVDARPVQWYPSRMRSREAAKHAAVVDLFCGIGGLSYAFKQEGFNVAAGVDADPTCHFAFERNVRASFVEADIAKLTGTRLAALFPRTDVRVLAGCAPCQPFSIYTRSASENKQWQLLQEFARLATSVRPDIITMENVPRLVDHPVFDKFVARLERLGYRLSWTVARASKYGVPQRRSRLVLLASKFGTIELIRPDARAPVATVRDAIGHLPALQAGGTDATDPIHRCRGLSEVNLQRLRATPEGGSWATWDDSLKLQCHRSDRGASFRSVYGRMKWDEPSPVITTQCLGIGNGRFGHPDQDRAISLREAALLQTFPPSYQFADPDARFSAAAIARQIGNAVPVKLGRVIARSIAVHLKENL